MGFKNIKACLVEIPLERVVSGAIPEFITTSQLLDSGRKAEVRGLLALAQGRCLGIPS